METQVVIIGAGPAGLTSAYLLTKAKVPVIVLEADPTYVGGIAKTVTYQDYAFDIGGHRFFSKSQEIEDLWTEILPADMLERPRSSRIYYRQQFFSYPIKAFEALRKLGLLESIYCVFSYLKAQVKPIKQPISFTDWVTNQFGKRLYNIFFKTYTEKVWGMPCEEISADWAAQRIKGLSLTSAIIHALLPKKWHKRDKKIIKTLIDTFRYPRKGPGMLWEACAHKVKQQGGEIFLDSRVDLCEYQPLHNQWLVSYRDCHGNRYQVLTTHLISSAPLRELVLDYLKPQISKCAIDAAQQLQYRDFLIVVLMLRDQHKFSDNWIYVHDNQVDVARIQNFKSWSPEMVPDQTMCCYGMEYFCFKNDAYWSLSDEQLIEKAKQEIIKLKLARAEDIFDGCVVRQAKAYPVYDNYYLAHVASIRHELENNFPSLHVIGRNGMHKYNNQDHAMMTGILTVKNILAGKRLYDVWQVNQDAEYHETGRAGGGNSIELRAVPERVGK